MARYALVIGIGENASPFSSLSKTVGDAKAIAQVLKEHGHFRVELLIQSKQVQYKSLATAIETFVRERAAGDEALIYYAGHGFPLVRSFGRTEAFLAPADCVVTLDGDLIVAQQNGLSLADLNELVAKANFSNLVMLLDCCHSGYLLETDLLRQTFNDFSQKDYWLMTACRSFERAWAKKSAAHSVFTGALLSGLERSCADERGVITAGRLFEHVQRTLRQEEQEVVQLAVGRPIELVRFPLETSTVAVDETLEPYQGLNAFTPATAQFFFGREDEIQTLVQQLHTHCFVPVIGASGSGKSSLVRAGLVPRLEELGWKVLEPIKPGATPIAELKLAFRPVFSESDVAEVYSSIEAQDLVKVAQLLPEPDRWLLVVDQFEEVFTLAEPSQQASFIRTLTSAMGQADARLAIVTTMRADFVEPWLAYGELARAIRSQAVFLQPMTEEGLEAAIVQPAKELNYQVQERLRADMLSEVKAEENSLPLLQFALQQLWEVRDREQRELTYTAYRQLGGVAGALNQKAEAIYQRLDAEGKGDWVRRVLLKLVRTGEGTKDTRQRRLKTELLDMGRNEATRQTIAQVIAALVDGRLLVSDRVNEQDVIDLSHEALIGKWSRLAKWREQDRDMRRTVDKIEDAQREWQKRGRKRHDLLQGRLLKDARRLLKQQPEELAGAQGFIRSSLQWGQFQAVSGLVLPLVILGVPAEYYWREEAVKQDYDRIVRLTGGEPGESLAVLNLASGCWSVKLFSQVPAYFRERIFGNCRSLESTKLDKANLDSANLSGANLDSANLSGANLENANLSGANLNFLNLSGANLNFANLSGANLNFANLNSADFGSANLNDANLSDANLSGANLNFANLNSANINFANLSRVDLVSANLSRADLGSTNLSYADLTGANLSGANLVSTVLEKSKFGCNESTRECTDLKDIKWNDKTQWNAITGWDEAQNIPPALKKQLNLPNPKLSTKSHPRMPP